MTEGETQLLRIVENLLDRKLGDIVSKFMVPAMSEQFNELRADIASLKQEFVANAAANKLRQEECHATIEALTCKLPGSVPTSQSSGTTLSAGAEFKPQPYPDADDAAYFNPAYDWGYGYMSDNMPNFMANGDDIEGGDWTHQTETNETVPSFPSLATLLPVIPVPLQGCAGSAADFTPQPQTINEPFPGSQLSPQLQSCPAGLQSPHGSSSAIQPPEQHRLSDRRSPALHRKHNPKSCMVCRGSFRKISSCKDHMQKCLKPNSGCKFMANYDHHMQLIRPFSGPEVAARWGSAISEWIHRKE
jgi:hypothetical protein